MHNGKQRFWQHPYGVNRVDNTLQVSFVSEKEDCGIVLYDKNSGKEVKRVAFPKTQKIGNVYYMNIEGVNFQELSYLFYFAVCADEADVLSLEQAERDVLENRSVTKAVKKMLDSQNTHEKLLK